MSELAANTLYKKWGQKNIFLVNSSLISSFNYKTISQLINQTFTLETYKKLAYFLFKKRPRRSKESFGLSVRLGIISEFHCKGSDIQYCIESPILSCDCFFKRPEKVSK